MQVGIQIVKKVLFRGVAQEFQNVYHYRLDTAVTAPDEALIDAIVSVESFLLSSDVTFVRGSVWSSGGAPLANEMRFQKDLVGGGNQIASAQMDRERAVLIRWPAGKDVRGRNVYLRKWFHSCGNAAAQTISNGLLQNTAPWTDAQRSAIATEANKLHTIHADLWRLCAKNGRLPQGNAQCHPYLEHHQLGEQWRS